MKKFFIILGSLIVLVLLSAVLVPVIFKDDIKRAIDEETDRYLNANVFYDAKDLSLSLFGSFPDLTIGMANFGIVGNEPFTEDTLVAVGNFEITVDIMSVITGDQIVVEDVLLDRPNIHILVLEDGVANYDIVKETSESGEVPKETSGSDPFSIAINHWEIVEGDFIYYDQSLQFYTTLFHINHEGSGDFAQDVFDMVSSTSISQLSLGYEGDEYVTNKSFAADITMGMDLANMKFTFKENKVALNDFGFGFEGTISMPNEDIDLDINFAGKDVSVTSILSLIPGLYQDYLKGLDASGAVAFDGYVRGTYNENSMPAIKANLGVEDGTIRYAEYPIPMEELNISSTMDYPGADIRDFSFEVDNFSMVIDGEKLSATLLFKDLEDYFWDLGIDGSVDLEKVLKIVPIEETKLSGRINARLATSGRMSDLEAERYDQIKASGDIKINALSYQSRELPQGFGIATASASFDPEKIELAEFKGNAGKTDLNMTGQISQYLDYALGEDAVLKGQFLFTSSLVDINEWMVEDTIAEAEVQEDTLAMQVVRIPDDIEFELDSKIEKLVYDNLTLNNFEGQVLIRNGTILLNGVQFDLLDGKFKLNGEYASLSDDPTFNFDFTIENLSIPQAFESFSTVQKLAPFARSMNGKFSTDFELEGVLGHDMMPKYETLTGSGLLEIAQAALQNAKLVNAVSSVSKLEADDKGVSMKDLIMSAEVVDGRVSVKPFDINVAGYTATLVGSSGVDGSLDYGMTIKNVSTGAVGDAVNRLTSSIAGVNNVDASTVDLNFGIGGTFTDPKVNLTGATPAGKGESSLKASLKNEATDRLALEKQKAVAVVDSTKAAAKDSVQAVMDEKKAEAEKEAAKAAEQAKEKAKKAVKNLFKKKKGGGK